VSSAAFDLNPTKTSAVLNRYFLLTHWFQRKSPFIEVGKIMKTFSMERANLERAKSRAQTGSLLSLLFTRFCPCRTIFGTVRHALI